MSQKKPKQLLKTQSNLEQKVYFENDFKVMTAFNYINGFMIINN